MSEGKDLSAMQPEELQSAVQSILKDPAFAKLVGELSGAAPSAPPAEEHKDTPPSVPQIPPEMLAKLPQMMSVLSPLLSGGREGKDDKKEDGPRGDKGDAEKRKRLLAALKPYLSSSRREAVDSILKVTEMTDLMGKMGFGTRNPPK